MHRMVHRLEISLVYVLVAKFEASCVPIPHSPAWSWLQVVRNMDRSQHDSQHWDKMLITACN